LDPSQPTTANCGTFPKAQVHGHLPTFTQTQGMYGWGTDLSEVFWDVYFTGMFFAQGGVLVKRTRVRNEIISNE